jgi:hypothetical protein
MIFPKQKYYSHNETIELKNGFLDCEFWHEFQGNEKKFFVKITRFDKAHTKKCVLFMECFDGHTQAEVFFNQKRSEVIK